MAEFLDEAGLAEVWSIVKKHVSTTEENAFVVGKYSGKYDTDVHTATTISLGFKPRAVFALSGAGSVSNDAGNLIALAYPGSTLNGIKIVDTGFTVENYNFSHMNKKSASYYYIAWR